MKNSKKSDKRKEWWGIYISHGYINKMSFERFCSTENILLRYKSQKLFCYDPEHQFQALKKIFKIKPL